MQFEGQGLPDVELHVVQMRLRGDLELFPLDHFLIRLLEQRFERLLPNRVLEALADQSGRRLSGAEAGQPDGCGIPLGRLFLGLLYRFRGHRDFEQTLDAFALLGLDLDLHRGSKANGLCPRTSCEVCISSASCLRLRVAHFSPHSKRGIPPMRVGRLLVLAAVLVSTSACFRQVVQTGRTPGTTVVDKPWAPSFLWGLVPPPPMDVSAQCRSGIATVVTQQSAVNGVVHILTLGLFSPRHITITCAASAGSGASTEFYVSRDATEDERDRVIARAVDESTRTQQPVVVRF
jgi:hypothetical protein